MNLVGTTILGMTAIGIYDKQPGKKERLLCRCAWCGKEKPIWRPNFKRGVISCGCKTHEIISKSRTTHGMTKTKTYSSWNGMVIRCTSPGSVNYPAYGGSGITVCDRWRNSFEAFLEDMGERPLGTSIDRIDVTGNYEPGNCRWATPKEQQNNRRNNKLIEYAGRTQTLAMWCEELGIRRSAVFYRLEKGTSPEDALTRPVIQSNKKHIFAGAWATLKEITDKTGLNYRTLAHLINTYGMTADDAVARLSRIKK